MGRIVFLSTILRAGCRHFSLPAESREGFPTLDEDLRVCAHEVAGFSALICRRYPEDTTMGRRTQPLTVPFLAGVDGLPLMSSDGVSTGSVFRVHFEGNGQFRLSITGGLDYEVSGVPRYGGPRPRVQLLPAAFPALERCEPSSLPAVVVVGFDRPADYRLVFRDGVLNPDQASPFRLAAAELWGPVPLGLLNGCAAAAWMRVRDLVALEIVFFRPREGPGSAFRTWGIDGRLPASAIARAEPTCWPQNAFGETRLR